MHILVLLPLCISCLGQWQVDAAGDLRQVSSGGVVYAAAPEERGAYAVGGSKGQSHYGYNTGTGIAKVEVRRPDGSVVGSYRYFDPNGKQVVRSYIADNKGFRVLGNDLPISPDTPASKVYGAPALTGAFEGTSEFDIPPPLTGGSGIGHQPQLAQQSQPQYNQIQGTSGLEAFQQQQTQLEQQREALRVQQQKLEELQRQLEAQQRALSQQLPVQQTQLTPRRVSSEALSSSSLQVHHPYHRTANTLTGGYTSPYYYYNKHLNYDFPAGFAYAGLPVTRPQQQQTQVRTGCYPGSNELGCGHNYIVGRAR
ncbi:uncharacterized protein LOC135213558 [Macrobrachium nipponense]|uniref:uncharacterized protein LOC135213558 n=1 Tax=Macrobrachium nipponense TaxID=159736 RepID=UPI0030C82044